MRIFQPTVTGSNTTTGSLHISGPVYFYTLETSSVFHVLTYNTSSGQVFFTASDALGGLGSPDDPFNSIQFNYSGNFSGSSNFTFNNNIVYLTGSMLVSGAISSSLGLNTVGFFGTASWAQNALTASFVTASNVWGPFGSSSILSASYASSSTNALTASYLLNPYPINVTGSSLYSVAPAAGIPNIPETNNSIFFGDGAGFQANSSSNSNFLGYRAGYNADTASNSNFLGREAGSLSDFVTQSNFLGNQAGYLADNAYNSNFLGYRAGKSVRNAYNSNFIGYEAGSQQSSNNTSSYNSNFIGYQVGKNTNDVYNSNFIGYNAGTNADFSPYSNFLGYQAGNGSISASYSNFIGYNAGFSSDLSSHSIFIGYEAGSAAPTSSNSTFIGYRAGYTARNSNNSIFIGYEAGREVFNSSHSIFIGYQAGKEFDTGGVDYVGPNNIIIGTNVTLPISSQDSINIGGLIFATGSNSNIVPTTPTATPAGGNVGINIYPPLYNFHASGTISFPSLTSSSQVNIVVIDTASGQLFYTASNAIGGSGSGTPTPPGGQNTQIQFNSASVFSGSSNLTFDYSSSVNVLGLTGNLIVSGGFVVHYAPEGVNLIDSNNTLLNDSYGTSSISWSGRQLLDNTGTPSIGWGGSTLLANDGSAVHIDWSNINYMNFTNTSESSITRVLGMDNSNNVYWTSSTAFGGGSGTPTPPGGQDTQIQFNSGSSFSGSSYFTFNYPSHSLQQGNDVTASGFWSHAQGTGSLASGNYSHAEGGAEIIVLGLSLGWTFTEAIGTGSHAEGAGSIAFGNASHAEGRNTYTFGDGSHAEGAFTYTSKSYSHAEGFQASASGFASHAEGRNTKTIEDFSHAEGYGSVASGNYSHAEGSGSITLGIASHAEGKDTVAEGNYSHAEGENTVAKGDYSHAEGKNTYAFSDHSHVGGLNTTSSGIYQTVVGQNNISLTSQSAFIVGGGSTSVNKNNAFVVIPQTILNNSALEILVDSASISASVLYLNNLPTQPQTHLLVYNTSSGQVYYTASSAVGGGTFKSTSSIIGDGINTTYTITHGFNTKNLHITVYETSSNGETVYPDIRRNGLDTAQIIFANPPSSASYVVYISQ